MKYFKNELSNRLEVSLLYLIFFFSGSNCFALLTFAFKLITAAFFLLILAYNVKKTKIKTNKTINIVLFVFILYLFVACFVQFFTQEANIFTFIMKIVFFSLLLLFIMNKDKAYLRSILEVHNAVFFAMCLLGVLGWITNIFYHIPTFLTVVNAEREYEYKFFYWIIADAKININGIELYRLQCFFDEPGTFALLCLPSFLYSVYEKNLMRTIIFFVAEVLSLSFGAIVLCVLCFMYLSVRYHKYYLLFVLLLIPCIFIWKLGIYSFIYDYIISKLGLGKYKGTYTSAGIRQNELKMFMDILYNHPLGISQINLFEKYGFSFSVSFISECTMYGILGGILRIILELGFYYIVIPLRKKNIYIFLSLLCLLIMGYQRLTVIQTYFSFFIFIVLLQYGKYNVYER